MKYIRAMPEMTQIVRNIAIINGQKLPAFNVTKSYGPVIASAIEKNIELLITQINLLDPHILIGGNTLCHYHEALGLRAQDAIQTSTLKYHIKDNRLYIDAYHPAQRSIKGQDYIDGIISVAEQWHTQQGDFNYP